MILSKNFLKDYVDIDVDVKTLAELIGDYVPIKIQTIANTFTFTGEWVDWADVNKTRYY
jgi:hypothetical protein